MEGVDGFPPAVGGRAEEGCEVSGCSAGKRRFWISKSNSRFSSGVEAAGAFPSVGLGEDSGLFESDVIAKSFHVLFRGKGHEERRILLLTQMRPHENTKSGYFGMKRMAASIPSFFSEKRQASDHLSVFVP